MLSIMASLIDTVGNHYKLPIIDGCYVKEGGYRWVRIKYQNSSAKIVLPDGTRRDIEKGDIVLFSKESRYFLGYKKGNRVYRTPSQTIELNSVEEIDEEIND